MASMNRRAFVKTTAAAIAAAGVPTIIPGRVLGDQAPSKTINVAIIGTGGQANVHFGNMVTNAPSAAKIRAVCDCFRNRREGFARRVNEAYESNYCQPVADFREVLGRDDIDAIIVVTPDHWHVHMAYYAALAGKHMYIEKPLSVSMQWAWELRKLMQGKDLVFQYGTQQRSSGGFRRAVELVRNGYVGDIRHVDCWAFGMNSQINSASEPFGTTEPADPPGQLDYDTWLGPAPDKPFTRDRCSRFGAYHIYDYSLGFLAGWGSHPLDIAQWGLDADDTSPVQYEADGELPPEGALWDTLRTWDVHCRYANGVTMRFMDTETAQPDVQLERRPWRGHGTTFHGSEGWVSVDRNGCYANIKGTATNVSRIELAPDAWRAYHSDNHVHNFIDCIRTGQATINPLESAIRSDTICHLADIAARTGRALRWDPENEQILGNPAAAAMLSRPMREPWTLNELPQ